MSEADSSPAGQRQRGLPIADAAEVLGVSVETLRKRLQRGREQGYKDADGTWRVLITEPEPEPAPEPVTPAAPPPPADPSPQVMAMLERLSLQVDDLKRALAHQTMLSHSLATEVRRLGSETRESLAALQALILSVEVEVAATDDDRARRLKKKLKPVLLMIVDLLQRRQSEAKALPEPPLPAEGIAPLAGSPTPSLPPGPNVASALTAAAFGAATATALAPDQDSATPPDQVSSDTLTLLDEGEDLPSAPAPVDPDEEAWRQLSAEATPPPPGQDTGTAPDPAEETLILQDAAPPTQAGSRAEETALGADFDLAFVEEELTQSEANAQASAEPSPPADPTPFRSDSLSFEDEEEEDALLLVDPMPAAEAPGAIPSAAAAPPIPGPPAPQTEALSATAVSPDATAPALEEPEPPGPDPLDPEPQNAEPVGADPLASDPLASDPGDRELPEGSVAELGPGEDPPVIDWAEEAGSEQPPTEAHPDTPSSTKVADVDGTQDTDGEGIADTAGAAEPLDSGSLSPADITALLQSMEVTSVGSDGPPQATAPPLPDDAPDGLDALFDPPPPAATPTSDLDAIWSDLPVEEDAETEPANPSPIAATTDQDAPPLSAPPDGLDVAQGEDGEGDPPPPTDDADLLAFEDEDEDPWSAPLDPVSEAPGSVLAGQADGDPSASDAPPETSQPEAVLPPTALSPPTASGGEETSPWDAEETAEDTALIDPDSVSIADLPEEPDVADAATDGLLDWSGTDTLDEETEEADLWKEDTDDLPIPDPLEIQSTDPQEIQPPDPLETQPPEPAGIRSENLPPHRDSAPGEGALEARPTLDADHDPDPGAEHRSHLEGENDPGPADPSEPEPWAEEPELLPEVETNGSEPAEAEVPEVSEGPTDPYLSPSPSLLDEEAAAIPIGSADDPFDDIPSDEGAILDWDVPEDASEPAELTGDDQPEAETNRQPAVEPDAEPGPEAGTEMEAWTAEEEIVDPLPFAEIGGALPMGRSAQSRTDARRGGNPIDLTAFAEGSESATDDVPDPEPLEPGPPETGPLDPGPEEAERASLDVHSSDQPGAVALSEEKEGSAPQITDQEDHREDALSLDPAGPLDFASLTDSDPDSPVDPSGSAALDADTDRDAASDDPFAKWDLPGLDAFHGPEDPAEQTVSISDPFSLDGDFLLDFGAEEDESEDAFADPLALDDSAISWEELDEPLADENEPGSDDDDEQPEETKGG